LGQRRFVGVMVALCALALAQEHSPPAGIRPSRIGGAVSILPGGRVIAPWGEQQPTGPEPVALAVSASGRTVVTANHGGTRASLTVMEHEKNWELRHLPAAILHEEGPADDRWRSVSKGLAFSGEHSVFVSEGITGRVSLIDLETGERRRAIDLDAGAASGDLAFDSARNILYVADLAHSQVIAVDTRSRRRLASIAVKGVPMAVTLAPDRRRLYVTVGRNLLREGEATRGVCMIDVSLPQSPRIEAVIPVEGDLASIAATADHVYVSDTEHDSIAVINASTRQVEAQIAIRIAGLEDVRGVLPTGMAFDDARGWLMVAEAGINAVGIIDTRSRKVLGHLPVGWFPTQVVVSRGMVYVANQKGPGSGPNTRGSPDPWGSVSMFPLPEAGSLTAHSQFVMEAAGFVPRPASPPPLPKAIRHVVLIVKEGRSYDEVLGDMARAANGTVMGAPQLARFGRDGYVNGRRQRLSLHHVNVTPNHHAIAERWTFSDNFYADADTSAEGMHWLSAWRNLARQGVSFARFGSGFDPKMPDTARARQVIEEMDSKFAKPGADLPGMIMIHLPNDRMAAADAESGFPYEESYLADNDLALGHIVEYLSGLKWWGQMAVFVTEASAEDGVDHIDAHRTLLLCAGPWARKNWVLHANVSFPGLLKTIFRLLEVPPRDLSDASAGDLSGCFADTPDLARYRAVAVDPRLGVGAAGFDDPLAKDFR
jgi:YVTN family beta-propeller protein